MTTAREEKLAKLAAHLGAARSGDGLRIVQGRTAIALTLSAGKHIWWIHLSAPLTVVPEGRAAGDQGRRCLTGRPELTVRLERTADQVGKWLRINRELETGDSEFDQAVYVESVAPDAVLRGVLAAPAARAAIRALLAAHCARVEIDAAAGTVSTFFSVPRESSIAPLLPGTLGPLADLAEALPVFCGEQRWQPPIIEWLGSVVSGSVFATGIVLTVAGGVRYPPLEAAPFVAAGLIGLALWLPCVVAAALLARGTSQGWRTLGLIAVPLLVGLPLCGGGGKLFLNGALDRGQPVVYRAPIVDKQRRTGNKKSTYHVLVGAWRPGGATEFKVDPEVFEQAAPGRTLSVAIAPGRFQVEWIANIEVGSVPR